MPVPTSSVVFRIRELELRYRPHRLDAPFPDQLSEPGRAAQLAAHVLRDAATEVVLVFHLNAKHRVIGTHRLAGSTDRVAVSLPEIVRAALLSNARAMILAHNHLSGDPAPSADDRDLVLRLRDASRLLGMDLVDAVIVVDPAEGSHYFSFKQHGLI